MRDSGLTHLVVAHDARQQYVARLAIACDCSISTELYDYLTPGAQVGRVAAIEHMHNRRVEIMCWPDLGNEPAVMTTRLEMTPPPQEP